LLERFNVSAGSLPLQVALPSQALTAACGY